MAINVIIDEDVLQFVDAIADLSKRSRVLGDLDDLQYEPTPAKGSWRVDSDRVVSLWKRGIKISRLTLKTNLPTHRFLYHYDETHECVFVMEIVGRDGVTYDLNQPHIERCKKKLDEYYRRMLWLT